VFKILRGFVARSNILKKNKINRWGSVWRSKSINRYDVNWQVLQTVIWPCAHFIMMIRWFAEFINKIIPCISRGLGRRVEENDWFWWMKDRTTLADCDRKAVTNVNITQFGVRLKDSECDAVQSGRQREAWCLHVTGKRTTSEKIAVSLLSSPVVTIRTTSLNTHKFHVLPTQCIYVFCVDLRTNSDYFPIQH